LIGEKVFTAVNASGDGAVSFVIIKLSNDFLQRFSNVQPDTYSEDSKFFDFFKGLYITTDFGSASMLYVRQIDLEYYHSYTYTLKDMTGQDSIVTVNNSITFPANTWVRQVNRFLHPDKANIINQLNNQPEQVHHISSPANLYTRIQLPIKEMQQKIESEGSRVFINNAKLRVDINNFNKESFPLPIPTDVLLIKENSLERFFSKRELPADTCAIIGSYDRSINPDTKENDYFYSFDISRLIAHEFKQAREHNLELPDKINFLLVPVRLKLSSNNAIIDVSQQFLLNGVTICGGNHSKRPIKANVVYSKF
jgi:hypothetical protein